MTASAWVRLSLPFRKARRVYSPGAAGDAPGSECALREKLLACLARSPADPHRLAAELACPPERLAEAVRELLGEGAVRPFADGRIALFSGPAGPDKAK